MTQSWNGATVRPGLEWSSPPSDAVFETGDETTGEGARWLVPHLPPKPFPWGRKYPRRVFGPPGTAWSFEADDLIDREVPAGSTLLGSLVKRLKKLIGLEELPSLPGLSLTWYTPGPSLEELMTVTATRLVIHGKLDGGEEVAHTFHLVNNSADPTDMQAAADAGAAAWEAFLNTSMGTGAGTPRQFLSNHLTYDEARASLIHYAPPAKPVTNIPTEYSPITDPGNGSPHTPLPYQVACGLTFRTAKRGPRYRGRVFLGPLDSGILASTGQFNPGFVLELAQAFHTQFMADATLNGIGNFAVVSQKFGTSEWITGVDVGQVPDTIRSRRRSLPETYQNAWTQ